MAKVSQREINLIAAPAILSAVAEPLIALLDNGIIKEYSYNPTVVTGAVGLAASFFLLIVWVFSQTRTAMSTVVAQHYGAGRLGQIKNLVPQMIWMNFVLGLLFALITRTFATEIFRFYNADGELLAKTVEYFEIRAIGYPFTLATLLIFGIFRGMQNTFWTMLITVGGAGLNLAMDILFMKGWAGWIEPMGIKGVAISSVIVQVLMFLIACVFYLRYTPFKLTFEPRLHPLFFRFMTMSGNLIIRSIAVNAVYFFSIRFAAKNGDDYLAVQTVLTQIWFFCAFFIEGYANAGNALVGKFVGQGNSDSLRQLTGIMRVMTLKVALFLTVILVALYFPLGWMLLETDSTQLIFYHTFWLIVVMQPIIAFAFVYDDFMKGAGLMVPLRNVLILSSFGGFVPCLYLLGYFGFKIMAIWIGFNVWMLLRAVLLRYQFHKYLDTFRERPSHLDNFGEKPGLID
ncbi:MAG TPA: MATE family efflux transporter [Flavobacteriales bacterium]|nr:MATE family efflux transporter [Flavobacteriales bacterium]